MLPTIQAGPLTIKFLAATDALAMFEFTVPPGARVPAAHHHVAVEEVVYVHSGILDYTIDGVKHELHPGDSRTVPAGVVHRFDNSHAEPAVAITVQTPGSIGPAYYQEMADLIAAGGPPDPTKIGAIMQRHGLVATAG